MSAAREAFVHGMHVMAALAGISPVGLAGLAIATLRHLRTPAGVATTGDGSGTDAEPHSPTPAAATEPAA